MKFLLSVMMALACSSICVADDEKDEKSKTEKSQPIEFGKGKLKMSAPAAWEKKAPKNRIVTYEFSIAPAKGDKRPGRLTMMPAGGSVKDNIARWKTQFKLPTGDDGKKAFKLEEKEYGGTQVFLVDIRGTYKDRPAPFVPKQVMRADYRMLGAIIIDESIGQIFVKMYGPAKTIEANAKPFKKMIEELKLAKKKAKTPTPEK